MWQPLWARPKGNCQLWPKWQVPMCGAILIQTGNCQTGSCHLGPVVAPNPVSQCAIAKWPQLAIASLGPEWPKSAVYISLKIGYFELSHGHDGYDITVTSHLGHWYLFQYVWKEETPSYTMVEFTCIGGKSSQWEVNHPLSSLAKTCYKKGLVRWGWWGQDSQRNHKVKKIKNT